MDRKLSRSLYALSTSGLFLVALLLVATPVDPGLPARDTAAAPRAEASTADAHAGARPERGGTNASRRGLALPYFSIARGMRRIGG